MLLAGAKRAALYVGLSQEVQSGAEWDKILNWA